MKRSVRGALSSKVKTVYTPRDNPKAKARELKAEWEALLKKHGATNSKVRVTTVQPLTSAFTSEPPRGVETRRQSLVTSGGSTAKVDTMVYSGDAVIGLAQLHKSNLVPIFKKEDAVDAARMRRG